MGIVKNKIMDHLMWSATEYDAFVFEQYWQWCLKHGTYPSVIQQMLVNQPINQWFLRQYQKQEKAFLKTVPTLPQNPKNLRLIYVFFIDQVQVLYPSALIKSLKQNNQFSKKTTTNGLVLFYN